jgi:aminopeptidase 2
MNEVKEILPSSVIPSHYDIEIETLFDTLSFRGNEKVYQWTQLNSNTKVVLEVKEKTNTIVLNSLGIAIDSARIGDLESSSIVLNEEGETATITFPQEIGSVGETITLALTFGAELNSNMIGYYKSKREINGKTQ